MAYLTISNLAQKPGFQWLHKLLGYRMTPFILCIVALLLLSSPGNTRQAAPDIPMPAYAKNESNISNNTKQMNDIHDIKSLEKFGINPALFWFVTLGVIVLGLIAASMMYWKTRKKKIPEVVAHISPEETAGNLLNKLQPLMDSDSKKFYFKLSMILREYIWQRFGVRAPEMTTEELLPKISELDIDSRLAQGVKTFAYASDPIKFAEQPAGIETMKHHLEFVISFVKETTPKNRDEPVIPGVDGKTIEKNEEIKVIK